MAWSYVQLSGDWWTVPMAYEDELPEDISDEDYDRWFDFSRVIDGVRVGYDLRDE